MKRLAILAAVVLCVAGSARGQGTYRNSSGTAEDTISIEFWLLDSLGQNKVAIDSTADSASIVFFKPGGDSCYSDLLAIDQSGEWSTNHPRVKYYKNHNNLIAGAVYREICSVVDGANTAVNGTYTYELNARDSSLKISTIFKGTAFIYTSITHTFAANLDSVSYVTSYKADAITAAAIQADAIGASEIADAAIGVGEWAAEADNNGINWADVAAPTTTVGLTNTTVGTVTTTSTASTVTALSNGALDLANDVTGVLADANVATIGVDVTSISTDATAADNAELFFDGTGYSDADNKVTLATGTQTFNMTGDITGSLSGSIGSLGATAKSDVGTQVWTTSTPRVLTAGTNIALAKGTGLTGLNDIAAADVWTSTGGDSVLQALDYTNNAYEVLRQGTSTLANNGDKTGYALTVTPPTAGTIADAVWDEDSTGHYTTPHMAFVASQTAAGSTPPTASEIARSIGQLRSDSAYSWTDSSLMRHVQRASAPTAAANAAAVWGTTTRTLSAGTNISLAKGTGLTGLNDIAATDVWAAGTRTLTDKTGYALSGTQTFNNTGTWTGNLSGSVGSVTGATGSVTGSVGSVAGAVGSVTGNVGGNVAGSVASVTGTVGSVTGNVGGNVVGSIGSLGATAKTDVTTAVPTAAAIGTQVWATTGRDLTVTPPTAAAIGTQVWATTGRTLTMAPPTAGAIADAVWDEDSTGHAVANTMGWLTSQTAAGGSAPTTADIWGYTTRRLTDATLTGGGALAKVSDLTGGLGSGPVALTLRALQGITAIAGVRIFLYDSTKTTVLYQNDNAGTDVSGFSVFGVVANKYRVLAAKPGYTYDSLTAYQTIVASAAPITDTIRMTAIDQGTPSGASVCRVSGTVRTPAGVPVFGATVDLTLNMLTIDSMAVDATTLTSLSMYGANTTTDVLGNWYLDRIPNALIAPTGSRYLYTAKLGSSYIPGHNRRVTVPNTSTARIENIR